MKEKKADEFRVTLVTNYERPVFNFPPQQIEVEEFMERPDPRMKYFRCSGKFWKVGKDTWIDMTQERISDLSCTVGKLNSYVSELELSDREKTAQIEALTKSDVSKSYLKALKKIDSQGKKLGEKNDENRRLQEIIVGLREELQEKGMEILSLKKTIDDLEFDKL